MDFIEVENYGKILVRDIRKNESLEHYQMYIADKIGDKIARKEVKKGLFNTKEYRRYKMELDDYTYALAGDFINDYYNKEHNEEENSVDFDGLVDNVTEKLEQEAKTENQEKEPEEYTSEQLCYLLKKKNPKIRFWVERYNKTSDTIYTDASDEELKSLDLEEGYTYTNGMLVSKNGNIILLEDVENIEKYEIKEPNKWKLSFLNVWERTKSFFKKFVDNPVTYRSIKEESDSVFDGLVENFMPIPKKQKTTSKKLTKEQVMNANVFSDTVKEGVMKIAARKAYQETLNTPVNIQNTFDVNLKEMNFPPRRIDCGCGIIEIYESEFHSLIDSKYNLIKFSPEASKKLTKKESEDFEFYYNKALKNAFDYSRRGKVKLTTEEHGRLLSINERYVQLLILEEKKKARYQKMKEMQEAIEREYYEQENRISEKYLEQWGNMMITEEELQPVKVIKK